MQRQHVREPTQWRASETSYYSLELDSERSAEMHTVQIAGGDSRLG
jgi:hypothetical protein